MFVSTLLENKVAVVTGGATGIGKEIARLYAKLGAKVVLASRNEENLEAVRRELTEETGAAVMTIQTDIRSYEAVSEMMATFS